MNLDNVVNIKTQPKVRVVYVKESCAIPKAPRYLWDTQRRGSS